jgi:TonB family protein
MVNFLLYSSLSWLAFYGLYCLVLRRETFHCLNRFYLLGALVAGLLIPLIQLPQDAPVLVAQVDLLEMSARPIGTTESSVFDYAPLLWGVYALGVCLALLRFGWGLAQIFRLYRKGHKERGEGYWLVSTDGLHEPFSFLNCIYLSRRTKADAAERSYIIRHEAAHVRQRHTLDVFFLEGMRLVFWFNPLLYFYGRALRETHEYLADSEAVKTISKKQYGRLLIEQSCLGSSLALVHKFNYSQIKRRIIMMTRHPSSPKAMLKYLAVLPLLCLLTYLFAERTFRPTPELPPAAIVLDSLPQRLVIVDGNLATEAEVARIPAENIASVNVLKGEKTEEWVSKYGEKARGGVVLVTTKNEADNSENNIETGKTSPKPLVLTGEKAKNGVVIISDKNKDTVTPNPVLNEVDYMPHWPGCEKFANADERTTCSNTKIVEFIQQNLKYPEAAHKAGIEGTAVIKFVVDTDGGIIDSEILKDPGSGCGAEALRVVQMMPRWVSGKKDGQPVKVEMKLPMKFKLSDEKPKDESASSTESSNSQENLYPSGEVEYMPHWPGCETIAKADERKRCSDTKILEFIQQNLKYPEAARKAGVEGVAIIKYVVDTDGSIIDAEIVRNPGSGTGEEALRVVQMMPRWVPRKIDGKPMKVEMYIPIKFKWTEGKSKKNNRR